MSHDIPQAEPRHSCGAAHHLNLYLHGLSCTMFEPPTERRFGVWTADEVDYALLLTQYFKAGLFLDIPHNKTIRMWLSERLHCDPMRVSKKFVNTPMLAHKSAYGYHLNTRALSVITPAQSAFFMHELRVAHRQFLGSIAHQARQAEETKQQQEKAKQTQEERHTKKKWMSAKAAYVASNASWDELLKRCPATSLSLNVNTITEGHAATADTVASVAVVEDHDSDRSAEEDWHKLLPTQEEMLRLYSELPPLKTSSIASLHAAAQAHPSHDDRGATSDHDEEHPSSRRDLINVCHDDIDDHTLELQERKDASSQRHFRCFDSRSSMDTNTIQCSLSSSLSLSPTSWSQDNVPHASRDDRLPLVNSGHHTLLPQPQAASTSSLSLRRSRQCASATASIIQTRQHDDKVKEEAAAYMTCHHRRKRKLRTKATTTMMENELNLTTLANTAERMHEARRCDKNNKTQSHPVEPYLPPSVLATDTYMV
jgi:hypothetical protein